MKLKIYACSKGNIAQLQETKRLSSTEDFLDLIGNANYNNAEKVIVNQEQITPAFFDLKTCLAGDILQKFSTYRQRLAIVGNFSEFDSKSLQDFIRESNRMGRVLFLASLEEALKRLDN